MPKSTPITVFTGFLGAGKTTIILSLLSSLPDDCKVVFLKNEFGDIKVDSKLAEQSNVAAVSEILNGCLCCVLVGQMETALVELKEKFDPDRIIIECSGSAFPATLAFQIRKLEYETDRRLQLDGIITVIDAENFIGYEDTSPTAKMQASYTDLILINKWENVSDRELDIVLDHLNTLNDSTPKIRCHGQSGVDPSIIFGLGSTQNLVDHATNFHHDEVETMTLYRNMQAFSGQTRLTKAALENAFNCLSKEIIWRVKGFVRTVEDDKDRVYVVNWAFGRYNLISLDKGLSGEDMIKLSVMGERGAVKKASLRFAQAVGAVTVTHG